METKKEKQTVEEIACKKYSIKEGLNDYEENHFNSTNVNLAKAFIEGYTQCQEDNDKQMKIIMETLLKIRDCKDYGNNSSTIAKELIESLNKQD
jgi:hypothetical protein